ncbi:hypothetical protein DPEC_G00015290 [Dallia pectoralis]|uniref:Uncharacterized protein n=1 Tax=Dallia pectoralis TaxID=75939 RepID=A0ACC2HNC2_DALPE|nr:hypothetical protein DPEC_G00015290 [Dallia pectoralis]
MTGDISIAPSLCIFNAFSTRVTSLTFTDLEETRCQLLSTKRRLEKRMEDEGVESNPIHRRLKWNEENDHDGSN